MRDPVFLAAFREAQDRTLGESVAQIRSATLHAVETLRRVMSDGNASAFAKVTAARTVLDYALRSPMPQSKNVSKGQTAAGEGESASLQAALTAGDDQAVRALSSPRREAKGAEPGV